VPLAPGDLTFTASAAGLLHATHGLHAFAARCPPPLAAWAIGRFSEPGQVVLDPMSGSGTTLVEACLAGRVARGADIDPLARLISKAKATPVDPDAFGKAARKVLRLAEETADPGWRPDLPALDRWFRPEAARDLARLRAAILGSSADPDIADLLWVCFSSLIVARTSVANARDLVHSRHHYRPWQTDPGCLDRFRGRIAQAQRMMAEYLARLQANAVQAPDVAVAGHDARDLRLGDGSVDFVFTSPPYCSALDYTRAHMFAVAWLSDVLGVTVRQYRLLGRDYLGSERAALAEAKPDRDRAGSREQDARPLPPPLGVAGVDAAVAGLAATPRRAWIVHRYFRGMRDMLRESARVTRPGGHVVLVVCPSNIRRVMIPTHRLLADLAAGFPVPLRLDLLECRERTIHDHRRVMPYLEAAFGPRMRTEYVLVLRRPVG
jgi:hypothetical protein